MTLKACHDGSHGNVTNCNDLEMFDITGFELSKVLYTCGLFGKIELTAGSKLVLWALCSYYNPKKRTMFPSQATLANQLGISEKTVERAVKELKTSGLVVYETRGVNHYGFSAKFWFMTGVRPDLSAKDKMSGEGRQNVGSGHRQNVGQTNKNEKIKKSSSFSGFKGAEAGEVSASGGARGFGGYGGEKRGVPSVEQTRGVFEEISEARKAHEQAVLPKDYSRERAYEWIRGLDPRTRRALKSVRFLCEKWGFEEFGV